MCAVRETCDSMRSGASPLLESRRRPLEWQVLNMKKTTSQQIDKIEIFTNLDPPKPPQIEVLRGLGGLFGPQEAPRAKTDPNKGANGLPRLPVLGAMLGPCWAHVGPKMAPRGLQEASKMHSFSTSISTSIFHRFWKPWAPILGRFWRLCWLQNR